MVWQSLGSSSVLFRCDKMKQKILRGLRTAELARLSIARAKPTVVSVVLRQPYVVCRNLEVLVTWKVHRLAKGYMFKLQCCERPSQPRASRPSVILFYHLKAQGLLLPSTFKTHETSLISSQSWHSLLLDTCLKIVQQCSFRKIILYNTHIRPVGMVMISYCTRYL